MSQYTHTISNIKNSTTITASFSPPTPTTPPIPTPTPIPLPQPTLIVSCVSSTSYSRFNVEINGNLYFNGTHISSAPILLSYSVSGGTSWQALTLVNTSLDGSFSAEWLPSVTGNYLINATYAGNSAYSSVSAMVNLVIAPFTSQSDNDVFSVASNATVSALAFNSTGNLLTFTVSGPSGTAYVDTYIAKSLIGDISTLQVYLDGNQINYTATSQGNSWLIYLTFGLSTHTVIMNLGMAAPKPILAVPLGTIVIASVVPIVLIVAILLAFENKENKKDSANKKT